METFTSSQYLSGAPLKSPNTLKVAEIKTKLMPITA